MDSIISAAIESRRLTSFMYDGYFRIAEPHCYGLTAKGKQVIRAFQVDGDSSDKELGWKIFNLSKAEKVSLLDHSFTNVRDGYRKGDRAMEHIFTEL